MQRVTLTLDDDLLATLDALSAQRGYHNRSEAVRDILRNSLMHEHAQRPEQRGYAVPFLCLWNMKSASWQAD